MEVIFFVELSSEMLSSIQFQQFKAKSHIVGMDHSMGTQVKDV